MTAIQTFQLLFSTRDFSRMSREIGEGLFSSYSIQLKISYFEVIHMGTNLWLSLGRAGPFFLVPFHDQISRIP